MTNVTYRKDVDINVFSEKKQGCNCHLSKNINSFFSIS